MQKTTSRRNAPASSDCFLQMELNAMQQVFIASQHAALGSHEPWADPFFNIYETCQEFEQAHLKTIGEADGLYVGEDAYPDSFNHGRWLAEQRIDWQKEGYDIVRAHTAFQKIGL